jgi:hypothetical protein
MATPAQVANDMVAQADFWHRRDKDIERCCRDAARLIRDLIAKKPVDGRTLYGLHRRLVDLEQRTGRSHATGISMSLCRARMVVGQLSGWELRQ